MICHVTHISRLRAVAINKSFVANFRLRIDSEIGFDAIRHAAVDDDGVKLISRVEANFEEADVTSRSMIYEC